MYFYSSGEASRKWENLKKRYSKKRIALKQKMSSSSGASFVEMEDYFTEVKQYQFLSWLDQFAAKKKSKTNLPDEDEYNDDEESEKENQEASTFAANTTTSNTPATNTPVASNGASTKTLRAPPAKKSCNDQTPKEQTKENATLLSSRTKAKRDTAETFAWNSIGQAYARKNKEAEGPGDSMATKLMMPS